MLYEVITGAIDYDQVEALAREHRPKMVVAGFSAYSLQVDWQRFRDIADSVGAWLFVDMAHVAGLIRITSYNVCYTKLLRFSPGSRCWRVPPGCFRSL